MPAILGKLIGVGFPSQELRHGAVSGTLGFLELARGRWGRAISSLITEVSQLRAWIVQMSAGSAPQQLLDMPVRILSAWLAHPALTEVPEPEQMRRMIDQIGEEDEGG
ncbi:MAG: hypothetical protein WBM75_10005 [Polyangiales bacterium]